VKEYRYSAKDTKMNEKEKKSNKHNCIEKVFAPLAFLFHLPTNPHSVPFSTTAPDGLQIVHSASNVCEADWIREMLQDAGFHVEYVPPVTTGAFGTSGSVHIYVRADEAKEAREFLAQLQEKGLENENRS
jgi:DNA-dependent RNA polymerase auxiliary subunit epsilon